MTKLDTCNYDSQRFEHVREEMTPFLVNRCGFNAKALQWLPAVGPTGDNVTSAPGNAHPLALWWQGPSLLQAIDALVPPARAVEHPLRVSVSDVFKGQRGGVVAGGKIEVPFWCHSVPTCHHCLSNITINTGRSSDGQ